LARVFQHEVDHLSGELFIDKAKHLQKIDLKR
jgi:peptide deformylase